MTFGTSLKRGITAALAGGLLVTGMSTAAQAAAEPIQPAEYGILAISNAPCDADGATGNDGDLAEALNGVLTDKLDGYMTAYRVSCAREIIEAVRERGLARRAAVIAVDTSIVETGLQNHDVEVDHDSLGLFQQRASWGSVANRLDPAWATNAFLNKMIDKFPGNGWQTAPVGEVAQTVQVSAYPDRYAVEAADAARIVDAVWDFAVDRPYDSFTGDAKADLVVHTGTDVGVRKGTGSGFADLGVVTSGWGRFHGMQVTNGMGRLYYGDFNGDHWTDMIVHSGTDVSVRLNTKAGGFDSGRVVSSGWGRFHGMDVTDGLGRLYFADYNGDGFTDMVVHQGSDVSVRLNTRNGGFDGGRVVTTGWGRFHGLNVPNGLGRLYFADYDGDGFDDLVVHSGTEVSVRLNTRNGGFDGGRVVTTGWGRFHGLNVTDGLGRLYFADYDGDGFDDLIVHQGSDVSVRLNTGSGFDGGRVVTTGWGRYHGLNVTNGLGRFYLA
ncbi:FG-GAP repeat domain-containing protein [Actinoplanes philippinensis]|uniref:FG-GAP repeat domain-containing protein n=1 Tax=Actinoplanes philippinensis TaxID=35752 RepID=UPI0033E59FF3